MDDIQLHLSYKQVPDSPAYQSLYADKAVPLLLHGAVTLHTITLKLTETIGRDKNGA